MEISTRLFSATESKAKTLLFAALFIFGIGTTHAQAPPNDDTAGAIALIFNPDLTIANAVSTTMVGATASASVNTGIPTTGCSPLTMGHDIWFKFTPTTAKVGITFAGTGNTMAAAVYHLNGSAMIYDACSIFGNGISGSPVIFFNALTPGTTYYTRVYATSANATPTFSICVGAVPAPPANDEAINAVTLTPATGLLCTNSILGTTIGATPSIDAQPPTASPACGGSTTTDDDVWYKFTATSSAAQVNITGIINNQNMYVALYSGSPGSLALSGNNCQGVSNNTPTYTMSGLTSGTTYYIRVYTANTATSLYYNNFNICIGNLPAAPPNDEITGAVTLPINPYGQCANTTAGTTVSATQSAQSPTALGSCNNISSGNYPTNDDVWYQFNTGSNTNFLLTITNPNVNAPLNAGLYTGASAATASFVTGTCGAANGLTFTGLTPNTTYYIRLYTLNATVQTYADFNLCLSQLPASAVNDEPAGAIVLTLNNSFNCGTTYNGSTNSATASTGYPAPTLNASGVNDDVWYKFTPTSSNVFVKFTNVSASAMNAQVYDASFNLVGGTITTSGILNSLNPNTNYYLRVYNTSIATPLVYSTFTLCLGNETSTPVANDDCGGAITITPNNDYSANNIITGTTENATPSLDDDATGIQGGTAGAYDDDVWYKFTANGTTERVSFTNVVTSATTGIDIALYSGTCGALTLVNSFANVTSSDFTGLTVGQVYYLRVYSVSAIPPNFASFGIYVGKAPLTPANDSAVNAISLPVSNGFGGNTTFGTLTSSTLDNLVAPYCASPLYTDVWYKVTVPASGQITIQEDAVNTSNTDNAMTVYSGTPSNLVPIFCNENGNPVVGNMPRINLSGQTPGATLYIRIGTGSSLPQTIGDFGIEAWDPSVLPAVSAGGNCIAATPITISAATGNNYTWVALRDASQNIIAELMPNGNNLGVVNASVYKNSGAVRTNNGVALLDRNITITPTIQPTSNVTVRLYLTNAEFAALQTADPTLTSIANLNVTKTSEACNSGSGVGGTLILQNTNGTYNGTNKYVEYTVSSFSTFYLRGDGSTPLPIELLDFKGYNNGGVNNLSWDVSSNSTVVSFELQRSTDGTRYETLSSIIANGKTAYSYIDKNPAAGANLYRLLMVDNTQKESYSPVVSINTNAKSDWSMKVFPNPAKQQLQMSITGVVDQNAGIHIFDLVGRAVKQVVVNGNFQTIDLSDLPIGSYIIKYSDNSHSFVSKIMKQ